MPIIFPAMMPLVRTEEDKRRRDGGDDRSRCGACGWKLPLPNWCKRHL